MGRSNWGIEPEVAYSLRTSQASEPHNPHKADDRTNQVSYSDYGTSDDEPYSYDNSDYGDDEPETHVPHAKPYTAPVVKVPLLPNKAKGRPMAPPKMAPPKMAPPPHMQQRASSGSQPFFKAMMPPGSAKAAKQRSRPKSPSPVSEGEQLMHGAVSKSHPHMQGAKKKHRNDTPWSTPTTRHSKDTGVQRACVHSTGL